MITFLMIYILSIHESRFRAQSDKLAEVKEDHAGKAKNMAQIIEKCGKEGCSLADRDRCFAVVDCGSSSTKILIEDSPNSFS